MADVNNEKILDNLKRKFNRGSRIIFWYDDDGEFRDEIEEITNGLTGIAQVVVLHMGEQLKLKLKLLSASEDEKFLIYSPEKQPVLEDNHLRDIILYSDIFTADAQEMIRRDLGLPEKMKSFVKTHSKFFSSKVRRKNFSKYDPKSFDNNPELAILATLVNSKHVLVSYFDILRIVLCGGINEDNYLNEFAKYDVLDAFWDNARKMFGYEEEQPSLIILAASLFLTETFHQMDKEMPKRIETYDLISKYPNVSTFVNQFSSLNFNDDDKFEEVADEVWGLVDGNSLFKNVKIDDYAKSSVFSNFDRWILLWEQDRLQLSDFDSQIDGTTFPEIVQRRLEMHYGNKYKVLYNMILNAWNLLSSVGRHPATTTNSMIEDYINGGYLIDTYYRKFILNYQKSGMIEQFGPTKGLIESVYSNDYLNNYNFSWTDKLNYKSLASRHLQRNFYKNYVATEQSRIVVIISDAFRFEAAKELEKDLSMDDQIVDQQMDYLVSGLPSVTYMGMPALLPNDKLRLVDKNLLVDDKEANNREKREQILINKNPKSAAYALDDLKGAPTKEIKRLFARKEVVYIYHNQIDAIADNKKTEDDVFKATKEAISEIKNLISRLRTNNISNFYVTADHGYIYRADTLTDADKIHEDVPQGDLKSQRYIVTENLIDEPGIGKQKLGDILNNDDSRLVYYPQTANVFKSAGSFNYVHGGASLQEMIVPLLRIRTTSKKSVAVDVELQLISSSRSITSYEVPIRLLQANPVDATNRPAIYNVYFEDDDNELISAKTSINANSIEAKVESRMTDVTLSLIDRQYKRNGKYYLVIENTNTGERIKTVYNMDIAGLEDFDF